MEAPFSFWLARVTSLRKATRIALALNALALVFWSWYSN